MNERILKLAEQAGLSHMPSNYPDMADLYKGADFELEKFAELIVRECAGVCEEYRGTEWGKAAECIGNSIKEHFGVEE